MLNAEYHEFKGGHTIPPGIADRFVEVLLDVAQSGILTGVKSSKVQK